MIRRFFRRLWLMVRWRMPDSCDMCKEPVFYGEELGPVSGDWWVCPACWDRLHKRCQ